MRNTLNGLVIAALLLTAVPPVAATEQGGGAEPVLNTTLPLDSVIPRTDISALGGAQYRNNNQRNYWWNAARGRWDGILPTASPPAASASQWWLWHDLGGASPNPVALSEPGQASTPDAYWHEASRTLYVFYSRGASGTSRFRRYHYDLSSDRYIEVSKPGGVAAPETLRGGPRVTIIRSPNGYLWAGVNGDTNRILVSRSTDNGDSWATPVALKATAIQGEGHWVELDVAGAKHVAFAATEDGQAPGGNPTVHFLHVNQGATNWSDPAAWTDETSSLPPWEGGERADDELSAVAFEDRAFVVIETEPLGDARPMRRPQLIAFERQANGQWLKHVILRYTSSGTNDAKRPVVTVDASARALVVTGGTTARTHGDMWYAPIDSLTGRDGRWSRLRIFQVSDPATQNIYNTRLPLPRFPVSADSDLLTLIDDQGTALNLWRQVVRAEGPPDDPSPDPSLTVSVTSPAAGDTVSGSVAVLASATNAASVEFFVDGVSIGIDEVANDGWSGTWDTGRAADGTYTLTAVATSEAGATVTSAGVPVSVHNAGEDVTATLDIPIAASADDAEERSNGRIWPVQTNLDFMTDVTATGSDQQRAVGLRFTGVGVPRGATITAANVQFQANKATSVATSLTITGHASDNATPFTTTKYEITTRPRTGASVAWNPPAWQRKGDRGADQRTPSVAPVLQELIARPGWVPGNAVSLIVEGTGERVVESFDGGAHSPTLHIEYRMTSGGPDTTAVPAPVPGTYVESPLEVGPFADANGSLYYLNEFAEATPEVRMRKSADRGRTWTEAGATSRPAERDWKAVDIVQTDGELNIFLNEGRFARFYRFATSDHSTTPDRWTTNETVATGFSLARSQQAAALARRADGTFVAFYNRSSGTHDNLFYRIRSTNGMWGAEQTLEAEAKVHWQAVVASTSSTDTTHVLYYGSNGTIHHRTLSSGNSLSARRTIATGVGTSARNSAPFIPPVKWKSGTDEKMMFFYAISPSTKMGTWRLRSTVIVNDAAPEPAKTVNPSVEIAVDPGTFGSRMPVVTAGIDGTTVRLLFADRTDLDLYTTTNTDDGTWATETMLRDALSAHMVRGRVVTVGGNKVFGFIYDEHSAGGDDLSKYDEIFLGAP
ncbi:MAG: Ig-like domain-containing protein [Euzebyaceae bacterium]|nr:Ig-like domain-containing protein [Euzebyaceae bacterium]